MITVGPIVFGSVTSRLFSSRRWNAGAITATPIVIDHLRSPSPRLNWPPTRWDEWRRAARSDGSENHMAFFGVDDVGAEQWHRRLNHAFSEATALRQSNYREDVLVRFGRLNQKVGATFGCPGVDRALQYRSFQEPIELDGAPRPVDRLLSMDAYRVTWVSSQKPTPAAM